MMLTCEEIFVIYEAGPEAVISVIQRLENIIEEEQAVRIAELEKRVKIVEAVWIKTAKTAVNFLLLMFFVVKNLNLRVAAQ